MKEEDLDKVIEILDNNVLRDDAFLLFSYNKKKFENTNIEANKEGLEFFAKELLKAAKKFESFDSINDKNKEIFLDSSEWYFASKNSIKPYINPIFESRKDFLKPLTLKQRVKNKLSFLSYIFFIVIVIFFSVIGFMGTIDWIIKRI